MNEGHLFERVMISDSLKCNSKNIGSIGFEHWNTNSRMVYDE